MNWCKDSFYTSTHLFYYSYPPTSATHLTPACLFSNSNPDTNFDKPEFPSLTTSVHSLFCLLKLFFLLPYTCYSVSLQVNSEANCSKSIYKGEGLPITLGPQMIYGANLFGRCVSLSLQSSSSVALSCSILIYFFFFFRVPEKMTTQAPTFKQPLQSVVVLEGSAATFEAHVSGKRTQDHSASLPPPQ